MDDFRYKRLLKNSEKNEETKKVDSEVSGDTPDINQDNSQGDNPKDAPVNQDQELFSQNSDEDLDAGLGNTIEATSSETKILNETYEPKDSTRNQIHEPKILNETYESKDSDPKENPSFPSVSLAKKDNNSLRPKKKPLDQTVNTDEKAENTVYLNRFPKDLVEIAIQEFPNLTQPQAVSAFAIVNSGLDVLELDVDGVVKKAVLDYEKTSELANVREQLRSVLNLNIELKDLIEENNLALNYLLYDRLGYRKETLPIDIDKFEVSNEGVYKMSKRLELGRLEHKHLKRRRERRQ